MCVCHWGLVHMNAGAYGDQKRVVDFLELESIVRGTMWLLGSKIGFFARVYYALLTTGLFLQPQDVFLLKGGSIYFDSPVRVQSLMREKEFKYVYETGSSDWPGTCHEDQAGFELTEGHLLLTPKS